MTTEAPRGPGGPPPRFGGGGRPGGPGGGGRPGGPGGPGGRPRGRFVRRRKVCAFCVEKVTHIDYKEIDKIRRFVSERAKIEPRRRTGVCAKHQRALRTAIQRARQIALVPFVAYHAYSGGVRR
ncbi:MAG: 30S ribosomal protein S18 [SAR202 cluster bacterium]|uniref:30S ribosomal protein S18 n=1 Tax=marine metagenome TaxID=408172 RepID=A0A381PFR5_9ZZZZ|nr:30S ribosomal protein S18 [SAR202 cluster bacterium]MQG45773.1 30S ribosomal protein S18 [SAR202 cluster bacterium]